MRIESRFAVFVSIVIGLGLPSKAVFGCSCLPPPPGITGTRELAEWRTQGISAIFEGRVEAAQMKSPLLEVTVGDIVPANLDQSTPVMLVSFNVSRRYRGARKQHVQVETGLGGGDCGFAFEIGKQYLVYAHTGDSGGLSTGICTATAPLEESRVDLAYLRGEAIVLQNPKNSSHLKSSKLCVRTVKEGSLSSDDDRLLLLRVGNASPIPSDEAEPDDNGNFCVANVEPGKYHLLFTQAMGESPTSFAYYPGVMKLSQATPIVIRSGQTISDLVFKIPTQPTFSVAGTVSTQNNSHLPTGIKVMLISADQPFLALAYAENVAPDGTFAFPNVLPGRYWSFVDVDSDSGDSATLTWSTRKTELLIEENLAHLSLTLIPN
jgi:hypothetical protein